MNRTSLAVCGVVSVVLVAMSAREGVAQYRMTSTSAVRSTRNFIINRPTVSPYTALATRDANVGLPAYFTRVRPQIEQRQRQAAQQRQAARMQEQINAVQTQVRQTQQEAANAFLTGRVGWSARGYPRFGTYMSYYPGFQRIRR